jgi:hypothetical protein
MARAAVLLVLLLLAACSEEKAPKQAGNEMIESPLQNTVISSFYAYPPRPVAAGAVEPAENGCRKRFEDDGLDPSGWRVERSENPVK